MANVSITTQVIGKTFNRHDSWNNDDWSFKIEEVQICANQQILLAGTGIDSWDRTYEQRTYLVTIEQLIGMVEKHGGITARDYELDHCSCTVTLNIY